MHFPRRIEAALRVAELVRMMFTSRDGVPFTPDKGDRIEAGDAVDLGPALEEYREAVAEWKAKGDT